MLHLSPFPSSLLPKWFYRLNKNRKDNTCDIHQQAKDNDDNSFLFSLPPKYLYRLNKNRKYNRCAIPQQVEDNDDDSFLPGARVGTTDGDDVDSDKGDDTRYNIPIMRTTVMTIILKKIRRRRRRRRRIRLMMAMTMTVMITTIKTVMSLMLK